MAVMPMKRINILALRQERKRILELLQRAGAVEVNTPPLELEAFEKMDTSSARSIFEKNAKQLTDAVAVLDGLVKPEKGLPAALTGRTPINLSEYEEIAKRAPEVTRLAMEINGREKEIADARAEALRLETQLAALQPWMGLDISMRTTGSEHTSVFIGSFPRALTEGQLKEELARALPQVEAVEAEIVSTEAQQTCVFVLCLARDGPQVEQALRSLGFTFPAAPSKRSPAERAETLKERIAKAQQDAEAAREAIRGFRDRRQEMLFTADYYTMRADKYRVLGDLWQSPHVFQITGYLPAEDAPALEKTLEEKYGAYVEIEDPAPDEDLPVKLKNRLLPRAVEGVVEGFSLPGKWEVDPSSVMCLFYYVLFGMMLSDAAYGLLMVLGCGIVLWKFKNIEPGLRRSMWMFLFCGISTTFWGIMFGSYFGDAPQVIARTFFNTELDLRPVWFAPLEQPMRLLLFSFLLGVVHLFVGLGVQFYQLARRHKFADAIYDVVFWYFLVGGLLVLLVSSDMFKSMMGVDLGLPPIVGTVAAVLAGIGAVGIILTAGRESKNPFKRLLKGLYGLYGISSWLSDILSYSRLLALGLATGVIAQVFNQIGSMMGGGVIGAIAFTIVFLIGHPLNLAINLLGAYVHTNRLQYVEFFGKFYEGGSRKFEPFAVRTKHFKITEEK